MTFKEINPMPLLKMGKTAYQWTKGALGHSNEPKPKNISEISIKV
jgi:hypothetical protein